MVEAARPLATRNGVNVALFVGSCSQPYVKMYKKN